LCSSSIASTSATPARPQTAPGSRDPPGSTRGSYGRHRTRAPSRVSALPKPSADRSSTARSARTRYPRVWFDCCWQSGDFRPRARNHWSVAAANYIPSLQADSAACQALVWSEETRRRAIARLTGLLRRVSYVLVSSITPVRDFTPRRQKGFLEPHRTKRTSSARLRATRA
jgi:hypothetical protein